MKLAIFGAQGYALGAYMAIKEMYPTRKVECFLVSKMGINAPELIGVPVRELDEYAANLRRSDKDNVELIIATPEMVQAEIEEIVEGYGFRNHSLLDSGRWKELMDMYHARKGTFTPLKALPVGCCRPFVRVYMAKSHVDRTLRRQYGIPEYMLPLQVGAELVDRKIADVTDNIGENISAKNGNYCELTALYWMWKNRLSTHAEDQNTEKVADDNGEKQGDSINNEIDEHEYYGLAQYRRMFDLSDDDLLRLQDNDVDVVLPYPLPYDPDIHEHHRRYIKEPDWEALMQALSELQPEYAKTFPEILEQPFLYNYNVILAKKSVLKSYCEWLFPILLRVEELSVPKGDERSDRYIGYMGETLETLYFMHNADSLNVVHTGCRLLV